MNTVSIWSNLKSLLYSFFNSNDCLETPLSRSWKLLIETVHHLRVCKLSLVQTQPGALSAGKTEENTLDSSASIHDPRLHVFTQQWFLHTASPKHKKDVQSPPTEEAQPVQAAAVPILKGYQRHHFVLISYNRDTQMEKFTFQRALVLPEGIIRTTLPSLQEVKQDS